MTSFFTLQVNEHTYFWEITETVRNQKSHQMDTGEQKTVKSPETTVGGIELKRTLPRDGRSLNGEEIRAIRTERD